MEKLQAALNKARKERDARVPEAREPSLPSNGTSHGLSHGALSVAGSETGVFRSQFAPTGLDALWQNLTRFDVPDDVLEKHRVVTQSAGPAATPFDILRTKILVQMRQNGWKRLAITSPMPNSGKSTMSCNLALGLGRQNELRSVLLDMDLRNPSVGNYFNAKPRHSIGELLRREVDFSKQAMRIGDNVAVSMAAQPEQDPSQLLLAADTAEVIEQIEAEYAPDLMIFDLPSVLVNDYTRAFLNKVDCALIVIRANYTRYGEFDTCEREIAEQTNVLGVVLNAYSSADAKKYSS